MVIRYMVLFAVGGRDHSRHLLVITLGCPSLCTYYCDIRIDLPLNTIRVKNNNIPVS